MGRDNKKKINKGQEKVNLKDIPLNWTEEEIINAYKNNSSSLEIKNANVEYKELYGSFTYMMKKNFSMTSEMLGIGTGYGYYFVSKVRLQKYLTTIREIFATTKRRMSDEVKISKNDLRERMKKLLQYEKRRMEILECDRNPEWDLIPICHMLHWCQSYKEKLSNIDRNVKGIVSMGDTLKKTVITKCKINWDNGIDILFRNDPISLSDVNSVCNEYDQLSHREKYNYSIAEDISAYKMKWNIEKVLEKITEKSNRIRSIRMDDMINDDLQVVCQMILEGSHILEGYGDMLQCLKKMEKKRVENKMGNIPPDEFEMICHIYMTKSISSESLENSEQNAGAANLGQSSRINRKNETGAKVRCEEALLKFHKNLKRVMNLGCESLNIRDKCFYEITSWLNRFCYVLEQIKLYRRFEVLLNNDAPLKKREGKADSEILRQSFEKLYDNHDIEEKTRTIFDGL